MLTLEKASLVCSFTDKDKRHWVKYSNYGYVVDVDGNVYSLVEQFTHGLILALLFPDDFNAWVAEKPEADRFSIPDDIEEVRPRLFQDYELARSGDLSAVRIAGCRISGYPSIDRGPKPITSAQAESLRVIFSGMSLKPDSIIETQMRPLPLNKCWDYLFSDNPEVYAIDHKDEGDIYDDNSW